MSGTSLDGVDGVLVDFSGSAPTVLQHHYAPFSPQFAADLLALNSPAMDEFHRGALAANTLARTYAQVVVGLLAQTGLETSAVTAIGAHGQTVRHRPQEFDATGYTLQLNNPALLAELTGIDVVADFRSRDVAAGGQGAPLVPAFHWAFFGRRAASVSVLNMGGIANLSVLGGNTGSTIANPGTDNPAGIPDGPHGILGFDCGPGNALMDHWCQRHTGHTFDRDGAWSASGNVDQGLLSLLLSEPYLAKVPPKSTGRDLFNVEWLATQLADFGATRPVDVQATLCEYTVQACAACVTDYAPDTRLLIVCGGGALNGNLMHRLQKALPSICVQSSGVHGLPPLQVEATAFAWLARKAMLRETGSLQSVTGARGARILGAIYPR